MCKYLVFIGIIWFFIFNLLQLSVNSHKAVNNNDDGDDDFDDNNRNLKEKNSIEKLVCGSANGNVDGLRFKREIKFDWQFDVENADDDTNGEMTTTRRTFRIGDVVRKTHEHANEDEHQNDDAHQNHQVDDVLNGLKITTQQDQPHKSDIKAILWSNDGHDDHNDNDGHLHNQSNYHNHRREMINKLSNDTTANRNTNFEKQIKRKEEARESSSTQASHVDNKQDRNASSTRSGSTTLNVTNTKNEIDHITDSHDDVIQDAGSDNEHHDIENDNHRRRQDLPSESGGAVAKVMPAQNEDISSDKTITTDTTSTAKSITNGVMIASTTSSTTTTTTAQNHVANDDDDVDADVDAVAAIDHDDEPIPSHAFFESMLSIDEDKLRTYTLGGNERYGVGKAKPKRITEELSRMPVIEYDSREEEEKLREQEQTGSNRNNNHKEIINLV